MKNKRYITIAITISLLLTFGISSFAMDFVGDGETPGEYLYGYIPLETLTWQASSGSTTNDLDTFAVPLTGFLERGSLSQYSFTGTYDINSTYTAQVSITKAQDGYGGYQIKQKITPTSGELSNSAETRFLINTSGFTVSKNGSTWLTDLKPQIRLTATSGRGYMQALTYTYTVIAEGTVGTLNTDDSIEWERTTQVVSGSYTQTYTTQDANKTFFIDSFFEKVSQDINENFTSNIGQTDDLKMYYRTNKITFVNCQVRGLARWVDVPTTAQKSIEIVNYFGTADQITTLYSGLSNDYIQIYGSIPRDVTIVNPPSQDFDFSDFGIFIGDTVGGFMNTAIFGGVTFGMIVYTALGIGLLMWILKMFGGG